MSIQEKDYRCKWMRVDALNPALEKLRADGKNIGRTAPDG